MEKKNDWKLGFAFNSFSGLVQYILTALLVFLCIPLFIHKLGPELFGVFSTVAVIGNLSLFANLSLDASLVKFLAEQGRSKESNYDIAVSLAIITSLIVPLSSLVYIFRDFILTNILNIPIEYLADASVLLGYLLVANALLLIGKIFTSILDSQQRIYLNNFALFIYSLIYWGGIIIIVYLGYGLKYIGIVILLAALMWLVLVVFLALKEWGRIDISGISKDFQFIAKKQLSYSSKIYVGSLLGILFEPLTKVLIANFVGGIVAVGFYEIGLRVKSQLLSLLLKLIYPLFPVIARAKEKDKIAVLVNKMTFRLFFISLPAVILIVFCSSSFVSLWLGTENSNQYVIMSIVILTVSSLIFSYPVTPIYFYLRTKNHAEKEIYIQALNVVVSTMIILLLSHDLGYYSVLLGNTIALFTSFCLCLYYQKKYLNFKLLNLKGIVKFSLFGLSMLVVASLIYYIFPTRDVVYLVMQVVGVLGIGLLAGYIFQIITKENIKIVT